MAWSGIKQHEISWHSMKWHETAWHSHSCKSSSCIFFELELGRAVSSAKAFGHWSILQSRDAKQQHGIIMVSLVVDGSCVYVLSWCHFFAIFFAIFSSIPMCCNVKSPTFYHVFFTMFYRCQTGWTWAATIWVTVLQPIFVRHCHKAQRIIFQLQSFFWFQTLGFAFSHPIHPFSFALGLVPLQAARYCKALAWQGLESGPASRETWNCNVLWIVVT